MVRDGYGWPLWCRRPRRVKPPPPPTYSALGIEGNLRLLSHCPSSHPSSELLLFSPLKPLLLVSLLSIGAYAALALSTSLLPFVPSITFPSSLSQSLSPRLYSPIFPLPYLSLFSSRAPGIPLKENPRLAPLCAGKGRYENGNLPH